MNINLIAIGNKMPHWVNEGYQEFSKRLPNEFKLNLVEILALKRTKNTNINQIIEQEGKALLAAVPKNNRIIVLDIEGKSWSTEKLAENLQQWREESRDISLLIGGPEGLSDECLKKAEIKWSLSDLTFPHPLVRVIVAEQLYRAWTILTNHPYHRGG